MFDQFESGVQVYTESFHEQWLVPLTPADKLHLFTQSFPQKIGDVGYM